MKSRYNLITGLGVLALAAVGFAGTAHAQAQPYYPPPPSYGPPPGYGAPPPPPRGMYRSGFVFGVGIGGGAITASDCATCGGGALGLELHVGGMIHPRMALVGEFWTLLRNVNDGTYGDSTLSNSMFTAALQYWVADQFWVQGGLGGATIDLSSNYYGASWGSESAVALSGAAGFEILQWFNFAIDLQFRLAHAFYSSGGANNIAFLVGFNWY